MAVSMTPVAVNRVKELMTSQKLDNAFLPFNRNGVLFPRRINDRYLMLSRPSDNGHTPFGDIFVSESPDLVHWGRHRHVMSPVPWTWQSTKIGAGPTPIETAEARERCSPEMVIGVPPAARPDAGAMPVSDGATAPSTKRKITPPARYPPSLAVP